MLDNRTFLSSYSGFGFRNEITHFSVFVSVVNDTGEGSIDTALNTVVNVGADCYNIVPQNENKNNEADKYKEWPSLWVQSKLM